MGPDELPDLWRKIHDLELSTDTLQNVEKVLRRINGCAEPAPSQC
jgi:hypothetical protein